MSKIFCLHDRSINYWAYLSEDLTVHTEQTSKHIYNNVILNHTHHNLLENIRSQEKAVLRLYVS